MLSGRVLNIRRFGAKFFFIKMVEDGAEIQVMVNFGKLREEPDPKEFKKLSMLIKRGDHICKSYEFTVKDSSSHTDIVPLVAVAGRPARTDTEELAMEALSLPVLFSPSLAPLPFQIPEESRMQNRHLDLLLNRPARDTLVLRHLVINYLRAHLTKELDCVEVQTPILAANAGGAVARPFATHATEFLHKELALRIAPELWLKRLVVAGFDRVFELGPSFRNEGVDATHNPEFTVCEFYLAHANLDALMSLTQDLFYSLAKAVKGYVEKGMVDLKIPEPRTFERRFKIAEFIPELEKALGHALPDLDHPHAVPDLIKLISNAGKDWHLSLPPNPSLPKLLDHMAASVIEPQSRGQPLYIIHHPVCMSPLAKSFTCPKSGQQVAARAELFYDENELANMYEEENDPFKQRSKFVNQAKARLAQQGEGLVARDEEPPHVIDEQYISVLESGLPPTGGWGCGVDRLVMLFSGAKRISDVLPFGNLRNVVGLASANPQPKTQRSNEDDGATKARAMVRDSEMGKGGTSPRATKPAAVAGQRSPSDFEALTATAFLETPSDGMWKTSSDDNVGEGKVTKKQVSKIIEDELSATDSSEEQMESVEARESQDERDALNDIPAIQDEKDAEDAQEAPGQRKEGR